MRFFKNQRQLMVVQKSLSDSKSRQVSRTLLSIMTDLNNAVVWIDSSCRLISKNYSPFTLWIVPSVPITIGITVIFMFQFFSSIARSMYLYLFSLSFNLLCGLSRQQSLLFGRFSFLLTITGSGHLMICLYYFYSLEFFT